MGKKQTNYVLLQVMTEFPNESKDERCARLRAMYQEARNKGDTALARTIYEALKFAGCQQRSKRSENLQGLRDQLMLCAV